jgi:hypothetical protein
MPVSLIALYSLNAYAHAEFYAQTRGSGLPAAAPFAEPSAFRDYPPSVIFAAGSVPAKRLDDTPYRSSVLVRFPQATLPQDIVDYLLNRSYLTGRYFSLFRQGPSTAPEYYEVREGSPTECDRSILGGEGYDALEEAFFGAAWVAHVHPPHRSPLPSDADLEAIAERAALSETRHARHALFGFHHGEPVCTEMRALWDPFLGGLALLHRASPTIAREADLRIQEWLGRAGAR